MNTTIPSRPFFGLVVLLVALTGCRSTPEAEVGADTDEARWQQRAASVEILRDDFGVPHVYGKTDADTVFGLLYAQAEDDFPRIERNYVWAIGRLAEVEGEEALWSDLRARLYMTEDEARAAYDQAPDWLQELCVAWADGLNWYLHSHPEVEPKLLERFEPWMPMYFFEGSIGGDIEQIPTRGIRAFYEPLADGGSTTGAGPELLVADAGLDLGAPWPARPSESVLVPLDGEPRGSNGIAIAGDHTASGDAMLLINPHTSFYFRGEVHAVSEEGLNAYGAVTWGQFFVYQGFSETNGWMHTSTRVDFMDEFAEVIEERDGGLHYRYGDEWRPVQVGEATLRVRQGDGTFDEHTFPTYRTHHGPITHRVEWPGDKAPRWVATKINWDPVNALRQSWLRTKTTGWDGKDGFREMMNIRTNSSNNTVYADRDGNIAYFHGNFVPRRDPLIDWSAPVDGSDPGADWQGLHTVDEVVTVVNPSGAWIQNANSTPFTSAGADSPRREDYARYMAPDPENFRGMHAVRVLEAATAEGAKPLSLDSLIALAYDPALPAFEVLIPGLLRAYDELGAAGDRELAAAIEVLRGWQEPRVDLDSVALTLAEAYGSTYRRLDRATRGQPDIERFAHFADTSAPEERLAMFAEALKDLDQRFGSWSVPWGEVNRFQRLGGDIRSTFDDGQPSLPVPMASGRWGALASYGARQGRTEDGGLTDRLYGTSGNSFVAVVEFGERVRAKSLLAGGQSGEPESPHFDDQAQRYVDREFKDVAYYREDVEARATRRYRPGG